MSGIETTMQAEGMDATAWFVKLEMGGPESGRDEFHGLGRNRVLTAGEDCSEVVFWFFSFKMKWNGLKPGHFARLKTGNGVRFFHWSGMVWNRSALCAGMGYGNWNQIMAWNGLAAKAISAFGVVSGKSWLHWGGLEIELGLILRMA